MTRSALGSRVSRRKFVAYVAVGTTLALLSHCEEAPVASAARPGDARELHLAAPAQVQNSRVLRCLLPADVGPERELVMMFVQRFEQQVPGINVELTFEPWSAYEASLDVALASETPPDIVEIEARLLQGYGLRRVLRDLTPSMQRDQISKDDFFPFLIHQMSDFQASSRLWALPKASAVYVVYYNRDLFDRAGVAYPRMDWTFEEFRETARSLTSDRAGNPRTSSQFDNSSVAIWGLDWSRHPADVVLPSSDLLQGVAWGQAGPWFSDDLTRVYLDDPLHVAFLRKIIEMRCKDYTIAQGSVGGDRWLRGFAAMCVAPYEKSYFYQVEKRTFAYDIVATPAGPWGQFNAATCTGWSIPAGAALPDEAWEFIKFLVAPEQQTLLAQMRRWCPALKASAPSLKPDGNQPPANFLSALYDPMFGQSAIKTVPIASPPYSVELRQIWQAEFGALVACGGADIAEAAQRASQQIQTLLDRAWSDSTATRGS